MKLLCYLIGECIHVNIQMSVYMFVNVCKYVYT